MSNTIGEPEITEPLHARRSIRPRSVDDVRGQRQPDRRKEGDKVTSRMIRDRLFREAEGNVAIKVTETAEQGQPMKSPAAASSSSAC